MLKLRNALKRANKTANAEYAIRDFCNTIQNTNQGIMYRGRYWRRECTFKWIGTRPKKTLKFTIGMLSDSRGSLVEITLDHNLKLKAEHYK